MNPAIVILVTIGFSFALALLLGFLLGVFRQAFAIPRNPLIDTVRAALPGANCGACGYPGCDGYALAVAERGESVELCTSGGKQCAQDLAKLMGVETGAIDLEAILRCQGTCDKAPNKGSYSGVETCKAAKLATGGVKFCPWGCMGFGDCVAVCAFGAISMGPGGIPVIDYDKCVGCGMCGKACPQKLFSILPRDLEAAIALCSNRDPVKKNVAKACKKGCIKCELCVKNCPTQAISMDRGQPLVDGELCTSCGACVEKCPTGVFTLIQEFERKRKLAAPAPVADGEELED